jgi:hypothetical protein
LAGKTVQWRLAILKRVLHESTEVIGALEHLALRIFFMVEVFLQLFKYPQ